VLRRKSLSISTTGQLTESGGRGLRTPERTHTYLRAAVRAGSPDLWQTARPAVPCTAPKYPGMPILRLSDVHLAYGHHPLLDGVDLVLERRERVALVGRNGAGKSSLLRILLGAVTPDAGERWIADGLRIAYLQQDVPDQPGVTIAGLVAGGLCDAESWDRDHRVAALLTSMGLPADQPMAECSGGVRRRALLAQALVGEPDLLLLDEPTNHLDIEAIDALEATLLQYRGAVVFVTHDRALIERVAARIVDLDRGRLSSYPGNYRTYLERRAAVRQGEARADARFDRTLAAEEVWIRQGIEARRTRNEGRVRRLQQLRRERSERIGQAGQVRMTLDSGQQSGALVMELDRVSFARERPIIRDFSIRIMRGDRIGIVGPNGCGKTTLLSILLGDLEPDSGSVRQGTRLQVAYFDQQREQLRLEESVRANVVEGSDFIQVGKRSRHVIGYLQDFLFDPARCNSPVKSLSGGERNRLLLARLFSKPANVLVLDEPTNDLDIETLELLEELIADYDGTVLLVSHDRAFLDAVVTSTIDFAGDGVLREYTGGYSDLVRQRRPAVAAEAPRADAPLQPKRSDAQPGAGRSRRLSYAESRELAALPGQIEVLESRQQALHGLVADPEFYRRGPDEIAAPLAELAEVEALLEQAYDRWQALESIASG
jgi:ATP-binding cassette subfamily F protein uup